MLQKNSTYKYFYICLIFTFLLNPFSSSNASAQDTASSPSIPDWSIHSGDELLTVNNEKQTEGTNSLRFEAKSDSLTDIYSSQMEVNSDKEYLVKAKVNMTEPVTHSLGFYLVSYDKNGTQIDSHREGFTADAFALNEWTDISMKLTVPEETASVRIRFYTGKVTEMVAYVDHIQLFELDASENQMEKQIPNGGFEKADNASDPGSEDTPEAIDNSSFESYEVSGWVIEDPGGGPYISKEQAYSGNQSLKFIAKNQSNTDVRTSRIPVEGDKNYKVKARVNMTELINNSYSFVWYLSAYDANGNEIKSDNKLLKADDFIKNEWVEIEHQTKLPPEAEYVVFRMYTGNPTETIAYVDDVRLFEVKDQEEVSLEHENLSFEESLVVPNWGLSGEEVRVTSEESLSGNYSAYMNNPNNESVSLRSEKISINPGEMYYFSMYHILDNTSDQGTFRVEFFDENEEKIDQETKNLSNKNSEWNLLIIEKRAPEDASFATIQIENQEGNKLNGYVDLVQITNEYPDDNASYPKTIQNPGFEDTVNGGNIPSWHIDENHPNSTVEVTEKQAYSGNKSLYFYDRSPDAGLRVSSAPVTVQDGKEYLAQTEAYIIYQSHRIVLELNFYNNNDELLETETSLFNNLPTEVWTTLPISATAPEGSSYATVDFYSGGISVTEVYFDDVEIKEQEPELELETNLGEPIDLGQPVKVPLAQGGLIGTTPAGDNEVYMVANGDPGVFHVLDAETGELKFHQQLESGDETVWGMTFATDNNVYFVSDSTGILYRYDPINMKMDNIGIIPSDDKKVWALTSTDDGKIYGGTYPGATVFEYDTNTDEFKDFGRVHPEEQYVRGIGATNSHIYAAIGSNKHLMKIDRKTGDIEEVTVETSEFPEHQSGENGFYSDIWVIDGKLFIQSGASKILVVEEDTLEAINLLDVSDQISSPSPYNSNLIYFKSGEELHTYNMKLNEVEKLEGLPSLPDTPRVKSLEWITLQEGDKAGRTVLAAVTQYSEYFIYDPTSHSIDFTGLEVEAQPVNIQSLEVNNNNKLYVGGFQRGLSILNPENDEVEKTFGIFRQAEGIGFKNDIAYFGTYTGAQIYAYDPNKDDNFGPTSNHNPGLVYDVPNEQDRPFVVTPGEDHMFFGSVPGYGLLGGSLTIYDEQTNTWESHRNIVEQQSIIGLAYKDGLLYGGTSIWGGQGGSPEKSEAKIFIWDVEKGEKVKEFTPEIPNIDQSPKMIGALSFGEDGYLWGAIDGTIFALDPNTLEVVKSKVIEPSTYSSSKWRPHYLRWGNDGLLYTTLSRQLVVIDPETLKHRVFDELGTVDLMTLTESGDVYYSSNSRLFKLPFMGDNNNDNEGSNPGEGNETPEEDVEIDLNEKQVVKAAMNYTINGSNAQITMPSDLPEGTTIVIEPLNVENTNHEGLNIAGEAFNITVEYPADASEPTDDFILELGYQAEANSGDVAIYYYNEETGNWEHRGGEVGRYNQTIRLAVPHFSAYGVFAEAEDDEPVNTDPGSAEDKDSSSNGEDQAANDNSDKDNLDSAGDHKSKDKSKSSDKPLPDTSTNIYNYLILGLFLILIGIGAIMYRRKKGES